MSSAFNYDWFTGPAFERQKDEARDRCARKKFPNLSPDQMATDQNYQAFRSALEVRTLIYLRDGFSYEMKELVDVGLRGMLTFECEPLEEQYKVGSFVVSVLFDEIVRVEVFAVHPSEKPEDIPLITGFRSSPSDMNPAPREDALRVS
ncbi:MAG TPA: hypothetical protein PKG54_01385 [Phycisphaerae bacterium]|jgi:hypothetical protein|nr:hypothetical protein [Phycisphaerae bacterium]HOB73154.1 hypothetical protein [Phycisphaerae bacterium]HOJ53325.1 hypothetical protein [Phycisphaerae bacterium]HOL27211.1 hypothetical protein [Phycisphaerae bacterium]HPP21771.1 hypothetical protein [Phycisphaerae bacterium]